MAQNTTMSVSQSKTEDTCRTPDPIQSYQIRISEGRAQEAVFLTEFYD